MKTIIAGSRSFNNKQLLFSKVDKILSNIPQDQIEIVSGGAKGTDHLAQLYAQENNYPFTLFKPNWRDGTKAGPIRNRQMAQYSQALIAFWDGQSKGTQSMIKEAKYQGLKIRIIKI